MAIEIPSSLVEFILLGPEDDRRQLQDSPILGDVWVEFAKKPDQYLDLLITPLMTQPAGAVAAAIDERFNNLNALPGRPPKNGDPNIAYLQGIVAARLSFEEVLRIVVPITQWWADKRKKDDTGQTVGHELEFYSASETQRIVEILLESATAWQKEADPTPAKRKDDQRSRELMALDRYVVLTGLILWARDQKPTAKANAATSSERVADILKRLKQGGADAIATRLNQIFRMIADDPASEPLVWQVSLNRTANPALAKSIPAVKADAVKNLFKVDASGITWAVIDSGIDGTHPAFGKADGAGNRVKKSFDFSNFRKIVSLSNSNDKIRANNVTELLASDSLKIHFRDGNPDTPADPAEVRQAADAALKELSKDAKRGRGAIHWDLVEKLVEINSTTTPPSNHGTHVAGIIGASGERAREAAANKNNADFNDGMCPDIGLYDFRVLGPSIKDTEFAIIGVLQYIRYLNDRDNFFTIHGANLSLSIPHDVRNFACGRTPICNECERLIESGVVVVAAAGNHGYKSFETKDGAYESYAAFSITDPGNADGVITVGATHRYWPHTYGVSFFSSRGPTGDGRLKPDLVAPGERIRAPVLDKVWGDLDGTSMAAPHVSGAAAMLMARYSELIGQPRRIKRILCETATDLGRERSFQGHGMLDVLRAFQSI
jgi:serine protease AprX